MKVYILTMGEYSDRGIRGVFTTLESAKTTADTIVKRGEGDYCADIWLYEVDADLSTAWGVEPLKTWSGERCGTWDEPEKFYIQWKEDEDND